jgi:hypothetical protein
LGQYPNLYTSPNFKTLSSLHAKTMPSITCGIGDVSHCCNLSFRLMIEVKAWQGSELKESSGFKHIPTIVGKCKRVNPKTPSGFLLWELGILKCHQDLGQGLGIKPCANWTS